MKRKFRVMTIIILYHLGAVLGKLWSMLGVVVAPIFSLLGNFIFWEKRINYSIYPGRTSFMDFKNFFGELGVFCKFCGPFTTI